MWTETKGPYLSILEHSEAYETTSAQTKSPDFMLGAGDICLDIGWLQEKDLRRFEHTCPEGILTGSEGLGLKRTWELEMWAEIKIFEIIDIFDLAITRTEQIDQIWAVLSIPAQKGFSLGLNNRSAGSKEWNKNRGAHWSTAELSGNQHCIHSSLALFSVNVLGFFSICLTQMLSFGDMKSERQVEGDRVLLLRDSVGRNIQSQRGGIETRKKWGKGGEEINGEETYCKKYNYLVIVNIQFIATALIVREIRRIYEVMVKSQ